MPTPKKVVASSSERLRVAILWVALSLVTLPASLASQQSSGVPAMSTHVAVPPDTLYSRVLAHLRERKYRIDDANAATRRLIVRSPGDDTRVAITIAAQGDSSAVSIVPMGPADAVSQMRALITVTHDATIEQNEGAKQASSDGALPRARWRPELFVTPAGRLWMARGGLYTADSAAGAWRLSFGRSDGSDPVDADKIIIGVLMAFCNEDTSLIGLPDRARRGNTDPLVYRTLDRGTTWSPVATPTDLAYVDEMSAIGRSVWLVGTRWENDKRRATFLVSDDAGATWKVLPLPSTLNDVSSLVRVSRDTAYLATAGYNNGPVFWRTTDGASTWTPVPTPHDQHVHKVPSYGVRVESIAAVGDWLIVREYGKVFSTHPDSIAWRPLRDFEYAASDRERKQLFVITASRQAALLDANLQELWRTNERVPASDVTNVEKVLFNRGVGYVSMIHGNLFEAHNGHMRLIEPRGSTPK